MQLRALNILGKVSTNQQLSQRTMSKPVAAEREALTVDWFPGWIARTIVAVSLSFALFVRIIGKLDDPPFPFHDPAYRNLNVMVSFICAAVPVWVWFCFRSRYRRSLRVACAVGTPVAVAVLVGVIATLAGQGMLHFSGNMDPRLATGDREIDAFPNDFISTQTNFTATPEDFPQFLGPHRSGWIAGPRLARDWDGNPPHQLWKRPIGAGWSAFAATNGFAVTMEQRGNEEWVTCYDIATGEPVWGHAIEARHESALGGIGPRSTPTIHNGRVYALGATGVLRCLDGSGKLLWSEDLRKRYGVTDAADEQNVMFGRPASPLIVDSMVIVPGGGPQKKAKNLVAFDIDTGRLVWEAENKLPDGSADQIAYASPALATIAGRRQILIVNESTASGHDAATGQRLWSHPWPGKSNGAASVSQPVAVGENKVLLSKAYSGGAELLKLTDGAGDELTVSTVWKVPRSLQTKFSNVVLHEGHAFALSEGILECVVLDTGARRWKKGRYGHGQILGVGDYLLVLSEEGELHLLELNPEKHVHLGSLQVLSGKTWNNLCLYGNRLLIRNAEEAACFELPVLRADQLSAAK